MHRLLSPSLVSLSIKLDPTDDRVCSFLQNYPLLCLGLKSVKLDFQEFSYPPTRRPSRLDVHQLSQAIYMHEHLESFTLPTPIDDMALRHLMLSPWLKFVTLMLYPKELKPDNISITSTDTPFRSVKELELHMWDLHFVSSLLRPNDQAFHMLTLHPHGVDEAKTILAFLTSLASPQRVDSLQSIRLMSSRSFLHPFERNSISYNNAIHRLTYDSLRPLTCFKYLRKLMLLTFNQIFLDDEELAGLACSWPLLEVLRLSCNHGCYGRPITLGGLLSLLTLCARLCDLSLSVDARQVPKETSVDVCNTMVTFIQLPDSPIRDAGLVADFFRRHLPSMTSIGTHFTTALAVNYRPPVEYDYLWGMITKYLRAAT